MSENQRTRHQLWRTGILITVICLFAVTGCGGNGKRAEEIPPEPAATETVATVTPKEKTKPTKKPEKKTEKPKETFDPMTVTKGNIEENFDEALKHVTICGKKLSFPFTLDDLGEDFDVDTEYSDFQKGNALVGDLLYQGKSVGTIWIKNGRLKGNIRKKPIMHILCSKWESCQIEYEICGVSIGATEEYVNEVWGEGNDGEYRKGGKKNSKKYIIVGFAKGEVVCMEVTVN